MPVNSTEASRLSEHENFNANGPGLREAHVHAEQKAADSSDSDNVVIDLSEELEREQRANGNSVSNTTNPVIDEASAGCPEWQKCMDKKVSISHGQIYTKKKNKRRSTSENGWDPTTLTWHEHMEGDPGKKAFFSKNEKPTWGFRHHAEDDEKEGTGFVAGACNEKRTANSVTSICAIVFDCDSGHHSFNEACKLGREAGYGFIAYTSHSHETTESEFKYDAVIKYIGCSGEPSLEQIKTYANEKKGIAPYIVNSLEVIEMKAETPAGWMIRVVHAPIPKYRMIFLLAEGDVKMVGLANTQKEAQDVIKQKTLGLADKLGITIDRSCLDVSRFFFNPRHKTGAAHEIVIHPAPPVKFAEIETHTDNSGPRTRAPKGVAVCNDGTNVTALYNGYAKRWQMAQIAEEFGLGTSVSAPDTQDKVHVSCPYADEHTDPSDDTATVVWNADAMGDGASEFARSKCHHNSCNGRTLQHLLKGWIDNGDLDPAVLEDPEYMLDFADDQEETKFFRKTPAETKGDAEVRQHLRSFVSNEEDGLPKDAEEKAYAFLIDMGLSKADARQRAQDAIEDIQRQLERRNSDRNHDPVSAARGELGELPDVLKSPFDTRLVDTAGFIVKPDKERKLYLEYGIDTKKDDAYVLMQLEIRDQMFRSMDARFHFVVMDGEAKIAMPAKAGERVKLFKDQTLSKLYANRSAKYVDESGPRKKTVTITPSQVYIEGADRRTYFDTCFEPNDHKAASAAQRGAFNLWTGFSATAKKGDWSKLRNHIKEVLCDNDDEIFSWVMTWLASLFTRPGTKIPSSIAVIGEQGTGKSKVFDWIREAIGAAALKVSSMRHITGNFNAHLDGLIFLTCEEAFWAGNKADGGVLKDLISSSTIAIEGKYQKTVERPNYVNLVFISNNKWTVPVDGEDARRFLVLQAANTYKKDAGHFGAIDDQMENGGLEAMVYELMNWVPDEHGLTWDALRYPPVTEALREQAGMGLSGPAERTVSIIEEGVLSGRDKDGDVFYYVLGDDEPTVVARAHWVAAVNGEARGNLTQDMKDAMAKFLGQAADQGDKKEVINYLGEFKNEYDDGKPVGDVRKDKMTGRVRHIVIPPLNEVRATLAAYGRG